RRRHTRSYGDWSSDVCSSDLESRTDWLSGANYSDKVYSRDTTPGEHQLWPENRQSATGRADTHTAQQSTANKSCWPKDWKTSLRSEERRVGKECRRGGEQST